MPFIPTAHSSSTHFCQSLTLGKVEEYNRVAKAFHPMMPAIPSKNIVAILHQL
jgi:hypothetical protein